MIIMCNMHISWHEEEISKYKDEMQRVFQDEKIPKNSYKLIG